MKWADYLVTGVKHDSKKNSEILEVEIRADNGDSVGPPQRYRRGSIIKSIDERTTYVTAPVVGGKYTKGATVGVVLVGNAKYLRTDANKTAADNLGNLPELA